MDSFEDFLKRSKEYGISPIKSINDFEQREQFNRAEFYLDYYKNLSPQNFQIEMEGDKISITVPKD